MTQERLRRILGLALPIMGGMASQNVLNLIDTAMVGTLGNAALAAVGLGGFATFMAQALVLGVATGVQAMAARRVGEGRDRESAFFLNAGVVIVWVVGVPLSLGLVVLVPSFYPLLNGDPEVIALGVPYLAVRIAAMVFVGTNFAFRGFWNAIDRTRLYMATLLIMHACNVVLNYLLIFGKFGFPQLGVTGAALGTSMSTGLGTLIYCSLAWRHARGHGFLRGLPQWVEVKRLVFLSLPSSVQQLFFAAGFTATYWIIGKVGTVELAAANVLINISLVGILPGLGLGLAAATLVGQALGRKDPDDASSWAWDVVKVGMVMLGALGLPMWLAPDLLLSGFVHDPLTLEVARWPMRLSGMNLVIEAVGLVLMHALLGAGDARRVMMVSIGLQWCVFLPLAYLVGPGLGAGLLAIWGLQVGYRVLQTIAYRLLWAQGAWRAIKL